MNALKNLNVLLTALIIIGCIACNIKVFAENNSEELQLTKQEKAWLKAHPNITLGYTDALEPDVIRNADGSYSGMLVDFLSLLNQKFGTNINLSIYPIPELLDNAQKKNIDGIISIHPEYNDSLGLASTNVYWPAYLAVFARKDVSFNKLEDFTGKRVALLKGVYITQKYIEKLKHKINIIEVDNALGGLQKVQKGDVDYFFGLSTNSFFIPKYQLLDVVPAHIFLDRPESFGIGLRADYPELVSILNKGIALISETEIHAIISKWSYLPKQVESTELSKEEKAWISENHPIRVSFWNHPPIFYLKDGKVVGIAVDLLNTISENTGLSFQYENRLDPFTDVLKGLKDHNGPDLVGALMPTAEREKSILFTRPYFISPRFIFTRDDAPFISSIEHLNGENIAVVKDYVIHQTLVEKYPDIDLLIFHDNEEALRAVSMGKAFAFIGDLVATPAMINEYGLKNIKAACPSGLPDHPLAMGIRNDWPELHNIIDKALDAMPAYEKTAIINKWDSVQFDYGISPHDVKKWILIIGSSVILIFFLIIFWNRMLNKRVKKAVSEVKDHEQRFRATFEQAAVGIAHVSPEGSFLRINQKFCDIVGYSEKEMLEGAFQDFTHPDDLEADLEKVNKLLKGELETYSMEKRYFHRNGDIIWVNLTVSLLRTSAGKPDYFISVIEEITDKIEAENRVKESEERFRNLMEQSPLSIQICDTDGRVLEVNKAWMKLWNISEEDLPAVKENYNILHDEEAAKRGVLPLIERAFKGEVIELPEIEYESAGAMETIGLYDEKAKSIWLKRQFYPVKDDEGKIKNIISIGEDITERKQADEKLKEKEEELKGNEAILSALLETSLDLVAYRDMNGCLVMFNEAFTKLVWDVFAIKAVPGLRTMDTQGEAFKDHWEGILKKVIEGEPYHDEFSWESKTGEMQHFEIAIRRIVKDGKVIGTAEFTRNITERKKADLAIIESEEKFRLLVEQSPYSIQIFNTDGYLDQVNTSFQELWGIDDQSLPEVLKNYNVLEDEEAEKLGVRKAIQKAFNGESVVLPIIAYDARNTMDNLTMDTKANKKWIKSRFYPVKYDQGEVVKVVSMEEDMTVVKMKENEILNYQQRLKDLALELTFSQEKQRKEIASELHDDVGQLLAASRMQIAAIDPQISKSDIFHELNYISTGLLSAIKATRRAIFELSPPQLNEIGLFAALADWMEEELEVKHGIKAVIMGDDKLFDISNEERFLLFRCARELLINVIKHAKANKVALRIVEENDFLTICVEDNGIGMEKTMDFKDLKQSGFGLFSIEERIQNVGGSIDIHSKLGGGTQITLFLPLNK